jgi:hypothetical protein
MRTTNLKKMAKLAQSGLLAVLALAVLSCEARTDRQDDGGIILSFSDFDERPFAVRVNQPDDFGICSRSNPGGCFLTIGSVTLRSIVKNANAPTSDLMTVEITAYEVRFTRRAPGTRTPPVLFRTASGFVPPGGTVDFENVQIMGPDQLLTPPLSDLLFAEGAVDDETNSATIVLDVELRFFGRTISGDAIRTDTPMTFTLTVLP